MAKSKGNSDLASLPKLLYRRKEAAFALGLSVREIDRLISDRELGTRRFKRCVLIPADDVLRVRDSILSSDKFAA
jgi:hypothetical protein